MRLGLMTVIVFLAQLLGLKELSYWIGIGVSTFLFAAGHLPVNFMEYGISRPIIARTLLLNSMAGLLFGWLLEVWNGIRHDQSLYCRLDVTCRYEKINRVGTRLARFLFWSTRDRKFYIGLQYIKIVLQFLYPKQKD